jgi:cytochrome d ubiquinol oxidase subunit II
MLLILTWAAIISFVILMYVLLDGFDLGIGILFPFIKDPHQRDIMFSTITPVWDGNETWLVMGAAALYAAFPVAYSTLLPLLYMPLLIMLAALIFRGISFEFRFKTKRMRYIWDISFSAGSIIAAFTQGLLLGTFVRGYGHVFPIVASDYNWFTPFSIMTGIAVVAGYALLGATWLIIKTTGELQTKMYGYAKFLLAAVAFFLVVVSIWTPYMERIIYARWFSIPNIFYLAPLPILTGIIILYNFYALHRRYEFLPFWLSIGLFLLAYIGFCISDMPYIIPHALTIWDAASAPSSLIFTLVGVAILLPILIVYTIYSYYVFRGKVTRVEHY